MATTLDFSTAIPLDEPKKESGGGVQLDFGSAVPLAGISKPKSIGEGALDYMKQIQNAAPEDASQKDKILAKMTSFYRGFPGVKQLSAHVGRDVSMMKDLLNFENPRDPRAEYADRLKKQESISNEIVKKAPETAGMADMGASIPAYAITGEALAPIEFLQTVKGGSKLLNLLKQGVNLGTKGAIENTSIQQATHPDAERLPLDIALGAVPAVGVGAASGTAKAIPGISKDIGSRLYDALFKRGAKTLEHEIASQEGQTLGKEMYDRGVAGTIKDLLPKAEEQIAEKSAQRNKYFEEYNTPKDVELPKNATYVDSPTQASTDDFLSSLEEALTNQSDNAITETGYPERVIKRRPKSVSTAMRPDDVVTRTSEAPLGRGTPEEIAAKNRAEIRGTELEGTKPIVVRENFAEGSNPAPINTKYEIEQLGQLRDSLEGTTGAPEKIAKIDARLAELRAGADQYDIFKAQKVKQNINNMSADAYAKDNNTLVKEMDIAKARGLKKGIEEPFETPEGTNPVRDLNDELSYQIRLRDALKNKQAKIQQTDPIPTGKFDIGKPLDALRSMVGLNTVKGASELAQLIKGTGKVASAGLNAAQVPLRLAPTAIEEFLRMSKMDDGVHPANMPDDTSNVGMSEPPAFRPQPGIDPSSLSPELTEALQRTIERSGVNPFLSSSGRTKEHNAEVNGVANSKHIFNEQGLSDAGDFSLKGLSKEDLAKFMQAARSEPKLKAFIHDAGSGMHIHTERR